MKATEYAALELERVIANGGNQLDGFSEKAIRADVNTLSEGMVFQTYGKVYANPIRKGDTNVPEYKLARAFMLDEKGKVIPESMQIVNIYPSFFNKSVVEVNDQGKRTGRIVSATGEVVKAYKSFGSVPKGFAGAIDGKVILVKSATPVKRLRFGSTTDTQNTHVWDFEYSDVELPKAE